MSENSSGGGGVSFAGLLFLVFLVLKLCKVITWSWWWVTSPLWISLIIWVLYVVVDALIESKVYDDD